MEVLEKRLKEYAKFKLIDLLMELSENKTVFNRIKAILQKDIDDIKA